MTAAEASAVERAEVSCNRYEGGPRPVVYLGDEIRAGAARRRTVCEMRRHQTYAGNI